MKPEHNENMNSHMNAAKNYNTIKLLCLYDKILQTALFPRSLLINTESLPKIRVINMLIYQVTFVLK